MFEAFKIQLSSQLPAQQQEINDRLKTLRPHRQIPDMLDLKSRRARKKQSRQNKKKQPRDRTEKRGPSIADSLKNAGTSKYDSRSHEIQGDDS